MFNENGVWCETSQRAHSIEAKSLIQRLNKSKNICEFHFTCFTAYPDFLVFYLHVPTFEPVHGISYKIVYTQQRLGSTCASSLADQSLRYPPEDVLDPWQPTGCPAKTRIRLRGCAGWSESHLGAHAIVNEMLFPGSFVYKYSKP